MSKRIYSTIVAFVILVGGYSNSNAENVNGLSAGESMMNNADTVKSKVVTKEKTVEGIEFLDDVITYRSKTEKNPTGLKIKKGRVAIKADCDKKTYRFNMPDVSESITIGSPWVEYEEPCQDIVPAQYIKKADFAARTRKVAVLYNAYSDIKLGKIYIFKPITKEESDIAVMPIRITDANTTLYTKINDGKDSVVEKMTDKIVYAIGKYTARGNVDFDAFMYNGEESSGVKEEKLYAIKKLFELESQGVSCKDVVVNYLETNMSFDSSYSLLLEYAMYAKVNKRITFKKNNRYYSIIPGDYYTYVSSFEKLLSSKLKEMSMTEKNISIFNYVSVIARPAFIYCLPDEIEENDLDSFIGALIKSACKMYSVSLNDDNYYKELNITKNKMDKYSDIVAIIESEY